MLEKGLDSSGVEEEIRGYIKELMDGDRTAKQLVGRLLLASVYVRKERRKQARSHFRKALSRAGEAEKYRVALREPLKKVRDRLVKDRVENMIEKGRRYVRKGKRRKLMKLARRARNAGSRQINLVAPLLEIRYNIRRDNRRRAVNGMEKFTRAREKLKLSLLASVREEVKKLQKKMGGWDLVRERALTMQDGGLNAAQLLDRGMKLLRRGRHKKLQKGMRHLKGAEEPRMKLAHAILSAHLLEEKGQMSRAQKALRRAQNLRTKQEGSTGGSTSCCGGSDNTDTGADAGADAFDLAMAGLYRDIDGRMVKTLRMLDRIGKSRKDIKRVFAAEGLSDTFMKMGVPKKNIKKAHNWITFALDHLKYLEQTADREEMKRRGERREEDREGRPETRVIEKKDDK
ncbi:MAG: hypothetical protein ABEJ96_11045, partial [Thiohalorhabdaceae bacterium]